MRLRDYLTLFILALLISGGVAAFQKTPGYMDADYYYSVGIQLASGRGLTEPFLWNYLDSPSAIPHLAGTYWMPLAGLIAALGPTITGKISFLTARIPFIFLAALIPPVTAGIAFSLQRASRDAWLAGLLALFSGFYLPYLTTTETFAIYMLAGSIFLAVSAYRLKGSRGYSLLLGGLAGVMHLTRADGILWLGFAIFLIIWNTIEAAKGPYVDGRPIRKILSIFLRSGLCLVGYLFVMLPWYIRNWNAYHALLSPAGNHSLWLTEYNDIVYYPAESLTISRWLSQGLSQILKDRLDAVLTNLKSLIGVQGSVFLLPLFSAGAWLLRRSRLVLYGFLVWVGTFLLMSLVFPYAGSRGGFFHSGAAVQPLLWSLAPVGLNALIKWGSARRGWKAPQAYRIFGTAAIIIALGVTITLAKQRIIGSETNHPVWDQAWAEYRQVDEALLRWGAQPADGLIVNNPPGYFAATGRWTVVVPEGGLDRIRQIAEKYHTSYLLIEPNHVSCLDDLYTHPHDFEGFTYLDTIGRTQIFRYTQN